VLSLTDVSSLTASHYHGSFCTFAGSSPLNFSGQFAHKIDGQIIAILKESESAGRRPFRAASRGSAALAIGNVMGGDESWAQAVLGNAQPMAEHIRSEIFDPQDRRHVFDHSH
jgi:hypothetical protein